MGKTLVFTNLRSDEIAFIAIARIIGIGHSQPSRKLKLHPGQDDLAVLIKEGLEILVDKNDKVFWKKMNGEVCEIVLNYCREFWLVCSTVCHQWRGIIMKHCHCVDIGHIKGAAVQYRQLIIECNQYVARIASIPLIEWLFHMRAFIPAMYYTPEGIIKPLVGRAILHYSKSHVMSNDAVLLRVLNVGNHQTIWADWLGFQHPQSLAIMFRQLCPSRGNNISPLFNMYDSSFLEKLLPLLHIANKTKYKCAPPKWKKWLDDNDFVRHWDDREQGKRYKYPGDPKILYDAEFVNKPVYRRWL